MSSLLPIDDLIVPAAVQEGYVKDYSPAFQAIIAKVYEQVEAEALAAVKDRSADAQPEFILVAGSHGVGKSHMIRHLMEERGSSYVVCDVDAIIAKFPGFEEDARHFGMSLQSMFDGVSMDSFRLHMEEHTQRYRNAAKYINDRLMTKAVREGLPVIVETNAKTPRMGDFLNSLKNAGVVFETHLCQAPLSVKLGGMEQRFRNTPDIGLPTETIQAEHVAMSNNMATIAAKSTHSLTIHWRQSVDERLAVAATSTNGTYTRNVVPYTGFNAYFMDRGVSVERLMGNRVMAEPKPHAPAPAMA